MTGCGPAARTNTRSASGPARGPVVRDENPYIEIVGGATVPVAVVATRTEAELIVGMLRSNGVRAAVSADDAGGQDPQLQLQGVRVLVSPEDEALARQLLAEAQANADSDSDDSS